MGCIKGKIFNFNENNENHKVYPSACALLNAKRNAKRNTPKRNQTKRNLPKRNETV